MRQIGDKMTKKWVETETMTMMKTRSLTLDGDKNLGKLTKIMKSAWTTGMTRLIIPMINLNIGNYIHDGTKTARNI